MELPYRALGSRLQQLSGDLIENLASEVSVSGGFYPGGNVQSALNYLQDFVLSVGEVSGIASLDDNGELTWDQFPKSLRTIKVAQNGNGDFSSIAAAVDSIHDNSEMRRYLIVVDPGTYVEPTINMKPWVTVTGVNAKHVIVEAASYNQNLFEMSPNARLSYVTVRNVFGTGSAIHFQNQSGPGAIELFNIRFGRCVRWLHFQSGTFRTNGILRDCRFLPEADFAEGFRLESSITSNPCVVIMLNCIAAEGQFPNGTHFAIADGPFSRFICQNCVFNSFGMQGHAFEIANGAKIEVTGSYLQAWDTVFHAPNDSGSPTIRCTASTMVDNIKDVEILNANAVGAIQGLSTASKVHVDPAAEVSLLFADPSTDALATVGEILMGTSAALATNMAPALTRSLPVGIVGGGDISAVSGRILAISAGSGYLMAQDHIKHVQWDDTSIEVPTDDDYIIAVGVSGVVTDPEVNFLENIVLGRASTNSTDILFLQKTKRDAVNAASKIDDINRRFLGPIFRIGSIVDTGSVSGTLNVSPGEYAFGTKAFAPAGGGPIDFDVYYRDGGTFYTIVPDQTQVPYNLYDDGSGTLAVVPAEKFTKHTLFLSGDGPEEKYFLVVGQQVFDTLVIAEAGDLPNPPRLFTGSVVPIASVVVQQGNPNILQVRDERPTLVSRTSSISAASDHGNLTGLLDNDHPQYLLRNGSQVMLGSIDMGGFSVNNVNLVDGVDVSSHASRHLPNGADPLTTAAPVQLSAFTNSAGVANAYSRSDHVHAHGSLQGGSLHDVASSVSAGFLSAADKAKLDGFPANPGQLDHGQLQGLGDDDHPQYARTDGTRAFTGNLDIGNHNITNVDLVDGVDISAHAARHLPTGADALATASAVGISDSTNAVGTANSFSRSDHLHAHGQRGGGNLHALASVSGAGFMSAADKAKFDTFPADPSQIDHGTLQGLGDDDHTQYALLAGRGTSQTLAGGTTAAGDLFLTSTSNASKGLVHVGQITFDEVQGFVGGGAATPTAAFDAGLVGYASLRIRNAYTPSAQNDVNGEVGTYAWDANGSWIKTGDGWRFVPFLVQGNVQTTDATATPILTIPMPTNTSTGVTVEVVARRSAGSAGTVGDAGFFERKALFKNVAGTVTMRGYTTEYTDTDQVSWSVSMDVQGTSARILVAGAANNTIQWHAQCRLTRV